MGMTACRTIGTKEYIDEDGNHVIEKIIMPIEEEKKEPKKTGLAGWWENSGTIEKIFALITGIFLISLISQFIGGLASGLRIGGGRNDPLLSSDPVVGYFDEASNTYNQVKL